MKRMLWTTMEELCFSKTLNWQDARYGQSCNKFVPRRAKPTQHFLACMRIRTRSNGCGGCTHAGLRHTKDRRSVASHHDRDSGTGIGCGPVDPTAPFANSKSHEGNGRVDGCISMTKHKKAIILLLLVKSSSLEHWSAGNAVIPV